VGGVDQLFELAPVADVARDRERLAPGRGLHLLGHRLAVVELAAGDHHVRAGARQAENDRVPEPAAATGHDCDFSGEVEISHACLCSQTWALKFRSSTIWSSTTGRRISTRMSARNAVRCTSTAGTRAPSAARPPSSRRSWLTLGR